MTWNIVFKSSDIFFSCVYSAYIMHWKWYISASLCSYWQNPRKCHRFSGVVSWLEYKRGNAFSAVFGSSRTPNSQLFIHRCNCSFISFWPTLTRVNFILKALDRSEIEMNTFIIYFVEQLVLHCAVYRIMGHG